MNIEISDEVATHITARAVQKAIYNLNKTYKNEDSSYSEKLIAALEITKWYFTYDPENKLQEKLNAIQLV